MASIRPLMTALSLASLLLVGAPALAQDDAGPPPDASADAGADGGADPCLGACGPNLRCIELEGEWFCGQCGLDEIRQCPECPGAMQSCGGDLYWEPCECPGCGDGPLCGPGLECINVDGAYFCGICEPGDARACTSGCGEGIETCQNDLFWGRCVPTDAVECVPGDELPCDSECGPGHMQCDGGSCTWTGQCVPDALIQCLPNTTAACVVGMACPGTQTCTDECGWGTCEPIGVCHECGDGSLDEGDGEQCDDGNLFSGDGCSGSCEWEDARPFKSFDCGTLPGMPGTRALASLLLGVAAFGLIRRRPVR